MEKHCVLRTPLVLYQKYSYEKKTWRRIWYNCQDIDENGSDGILERKDDRSRMMRGVVVVKEGKGVFAMAWKRKGNFIHLSRRSAQGRREEMNRIRKLAEHSRHSSPPIGVLLTHKVRRLSSSSFETFCHLQQSPSPSSLQSYSEMRVWWYYWRVMSFWRSPPYLPFENTEPSHVKSPGAKRRSFMPFEC